MVSTHTIALEWWYIYIVYCAANQYALPELFASCLQAPHLHILIIINWCFILFVHEIVNFIKVKFKYNKELCIFIIML